VIRVFNTPVITWTLTAVLLLSGILHFVHASRSRQVTDKVNRTLHALMNVLMVATLWNLASSTMLAQIAVLAGAALWFVIQAVARPEFKSLCAGRPGRIKCVYHSLSMSGAALMVATMDHATPPSHTVVQAGTTSMPNAHHAMAVTSPSTAATVHHSLELMILLTVVFGAAAVVFIVLLLHSRAPRTTFRKAAVPRPSVHAEHGLEALAAATMALMFASMTA
jgi:hypothetical protein